MAAAERMLESPTGERMIFRQMAQDTNGELLQYELFLPPHSPAPPSHLHPHQEERLRVVGTFAFVFPIVGNLYLRGQTSAMNVAVTLETSFMVLPEMKKTFPGPLGVGTTYREITKAMGRRVESTLRSSSTSSAERLPSRATQRFLGSRERCTR